MRLYSSLPVSSVTLMPNAWTKQLLTHHQQLASQYLAHHHHNPAAHPKPKNPNPTPSLTRVQVPQSKYYTTLLCG